jgi:hypothetical protein
MTWKGHDERMSPAGWGGSRLGGEGRKVSRLEMQGLHHSVYDLRQVHNSSTQVSVKQCWAGSSQTPLSVCSVSLFCACVYRCQATY